MSTSASLTAWQLRTRRLPLLRRPLVMGIVNVTPDSFSDGGRLTSTEAAVAHALTLVDEGADLLDIGGESTRPYADPVDVEEELRRTIEVVAELAQRTTVPISIDTSKARVAREALAAGAEIVNDVTGLEGDPAMLEVAALSGAGVCAMHMQGTPRTMQDAPHYADVVAEIHDYLRTRRDRLEAAGIPRERIALDPGIGFGKTHEHNLTLVAHCRAFLDLGCPLLVGHSRKGFIGKVLSLEKPEWREPGKLETARTFGTLGVSLALAAQGVHILRVHDVAATRQALALFTAVAEAT